MLKRFGFIMTGVLCATLFSSTAYAIDLDENTRSVPLDQSGIQSDDELASLFNTITKESQLIEAEKLLAQGLTPKEVRMRLSLAT